MLQGGGGEEREAPQPGVASRQRGPAGRLHPKVESEEVGVGSTFASCSGPYEQKDCSSPRHVLRLVLREWGD